MQKVHSDSRLRQQMTRPYPQGIMRIVIFAFCILTFAFFIGCVSGTPEQHIKTGSDAFQRGDTTAAIKEFEKALKLDKQFAPAHYNLGICYSAPKTRDKSVAHFRKAIAIDPGYAESYIALAQAYIHKNVLDSAVAVLRSGLASRVRPEAFYENLGFCYMRQGKKDSAIHYYQQACLLDPGNANNYFNIGYLLNEPGQADSSIRYLRMAYQQAQNKTAVAFLLGCRLLDKSNHSRREIDEGVALLKDYLAHGDGEAMKSSKAREKISRAGAKP
jgi:Tfp pilus assembly protein PilF